DQGIIFNLVIVMTTSAMGRNCVVLSLAMCLVLSSFHDVSCQVTDINISEELERQSITKESEEESSWEQRTTISSSLSEETKTEVVSGQSSSMMDEINREIEAHLGGKQPRADHVTRIGVSMDAIENDSERRKQLEEIEQQIKGAESETYQTKYGRMDEKEYCNTYNGGSRIFGSLGISQSSGAWRCVNHDRNGVNEEEDASIIIPKAQNQRPPVS
ncbi:hypothetical protein HID58_053874, partial [Brassica napus]